MKKSLIWCSLFLAMAISSCNNAADQYCNNGVWDFDAGETEIDCGGECEACPPAASLSANFLSANFHGTNFQQGSGSGSPNVYCSGTAGASLSFQFAGTTLNTNLPVTNAYVTGNSDYYTFELADTGSVRLTSYDELRRIISGTFSFSVRDGNDVIAVTNGQFANVRY